CYAFSAIVEREFTVSGRRPPQEEMYGGAIGWLTSSESPYPSDREESAPHVSDTGSRLRAAHRGTTPEAVSSHTAAPTNSTVNMSASCPPRIPHRLRRPGDS